MPSLAITLGGLTTTTTVAESTKRDEINLDGQVTHDQKIASWLALLRESFDVPPLKIESNSDFPANSGLASSASGFAALITAINEFADLGLSITRLCDWARRGSASAARSLHGGFVSMVPTKDGCEYVQHAGPDDWELAVIAVIVAEDGPKKVGSTAGMKASRETSPLYKNWLKQSVQNFQRCRTAVETRDLSLLIQVAEESCLQMHELMRTTRPALPYWTRDTTRVVRRIRELRDEGFTVGFTVDAGCHVKAICPLSESNHVDRTLASLSGVIRTILGRLGSGAKIKRRTQTTRTYTD